MKITRVMPSAMATIMLVVGACLNVIGQADTTGKNKFESDAAFVSKNIADNQMEIEMSRLALEKSDNQKVKSLAQQMLKDHTKMLEDLRKLEGNVGDHNMMTTDSAGMGTDSLSQMTTDSAAMSRPGDTGTASNQLDIAGRKTSKDADTAANGMSNNMDMGAHEKQGALMNASGKEFNDMWVSHMLDAHSAKLDELKVASGNIANPELKTVVEQAIPKVKMHKDRLEQMNKNSTKTRK
jgi:predicted outer membrane protein